MGYCTNALVYDSALYTFHNENVLSRVLLLLALYDVALSNIDRAPRHRSVSFKYPSSYTGVGEK